jgi:hypothetical protein
MPTSEEKDCNMGRERRKMCQKGRENKIDIGPIITETNSQGVCLN